MSRQVDLTQEAFDKLLAWLAANRDEAGKKYEDIRRRLIKIFTCRGCSMAEELADETFNRVTLKIDVIAQDYVGDPALYFYGVANKIYLEYLRTSSRPSPPQPNATQSDEVEEEYDCLERCMQQLPQSQRQLILDYYREDKRAKIDYRKELADKLGIALNALRIRAYRIRAEMQACMEQCMAAKTSR
jgi:DNA-directed RNA polymerase specialized sigma24 family protein